jgi:hypothetical protein
MKPLIKTLVWLSLFAIAMAFLETAVVVYLRILYYPDGFAFPLKTVPAFVARIEFFRELATVIMLLASGYLAGKTKIQRFAYFILAFAIWDLFYYVFLYVCLGWPQTLSTWDILFLIPVPWVGPVWAPCLLCLLMIFGSVYIVLQSEMQAALKISQRQWWLMISGTFICIVAFMWDYLTMSYQTGQTWSVFSNNQLFSDLQNYVPQAFNSTLFFTGFGLMTLALFTHILKTNKQ